MDGSGVFTTHRGGKYRTDGLGRSLGSSVAATVGKKYSAIKFKCTFSQSRSRRLYVDHPVGTKARSQSKQINFTGQEGAGDNKGVRTKKKYLCLMGMKCGAGGAAGLGKLFEVHTLLY